MKKIIFLSIIMVILLGACSPSNIFSRTVRGSGVVGNEVRSVSDFTSIGVVGSANISIVFGETESVAITTDENLLPYIKTEVRSGKLIIHNQENTRVSSPLGIHIKVTMKSLTSATLDGSGDISIADIHTDELGVNLLGSGSIKVSGIAKSFQANLNGSGDVYARDLQADSTEVFLNGSGNIMVNPRISLLACINGSGNVNYVNLPASIEKNVTGSGVVLALP